MTDAPVQVDIDNVASRKRRRDVGSYDVEPSNRSVRQKLTMRRRESRKVSQRQISCIRKGKVLEPFMTPLAALNMMLRDMDVPEVDCDEAEGVITTIVSHVTELQTSQKTHARRSATGRDSSQFFEQTAAASSQLATSLLSASQDPLLSAQSTQNVLQLHGKTAVALDVIVALCQSRGLVVERLDWRDLRRQQDRVGSADLSPRERALVIVDLYEPHFVILLAHSRREATLTADVEGIDGAAAMPRADTMTYMQLVNAARNPSPWRAIFKDARVYLPHALCAVAAVYRPAGRNAAAASACSSSSAHRPVSPSAIVPGQESSSTLTTPALFVPALPEPIWAVDPDWSVREARFPEETALHDDPFFTIPRIERPGARSSFRRGWTERLLGQIGL